MNLLATPHDAAIRPWWEQTYPRLARELGFDPAQDHAAAQRLDALFTKHHLEVMPLERLRIQDGAVVAGAADTLHEELEKHPPDDAEVLLVADGALTDTLLHAHTPHLVVTDLDGDPDQLNRLNATGVPLAVHAHGDNTDLLDHWMPRFTGPLIATRQTPGIKPERVICPGGFADGDRAVFLAARLGATRIRLVGFDLFGAPGKASPTHAEKKRRKMRWSARLLADARRLGLPLEEHAGKGTPP